MIKDISPCLYRGCQYLLRCVEYCESSVLSREVYQTISFVLDFKYAEDSGLPAYIYFL